MKLNKVLRIFSVIFECSFLGSIIISIYNYFISSKKYEVIPDTVKSTLNIFIIIAFISLLLFLIIKYVLYVRNKPIEDKITQLEMPLDETEKKENIYKNLEQEVTERVIIYKDSYDVPKDRRMECPNCKNIIDKNAFICVKCGYLLKPIKEERVIEKHIISKPKESIKLDESIVNILINSGLIIAIIVCIAFIINIATERGIIG